MVQGSMKIADHFGMPSFLVGFTLVAIGTSLPELGVVLNALSRGTEESVDLAVGGVVGVKYRQCDARSVDSNDSWCDIQARQKSSRGHIDATSRNGSNPWSDSTG